jgi:hypothetical protein
VHAARDRCCLWAAKVLLPTALRNLQGLTNVLWTAVFVGSAAYIARKDLGKVFRILKSPTENFIKEVGCRVPLACVSS